MKGIFSCFAESAKEFTKLRSLVITALFIAISMIIEAFSIDLQFAKLNFAFRRNWHVVWPLHGSGCWICL